MSDSNGTPTRVKIPWFGVRKLARRLIAELAEAHVQLERLGALTVVELEARRVELERELAEQTARLERERREAAAAVEALKLQLDEVQKGIVATEDAALLQEVGVYQYRHPLTDAVAYQAELARISDEIKAMNRKDGGAILASTQWTVNGSASEGRKMVREYSKLMLRAFNAEADNIVRGLKPYQLPRSVERLDKVADTIERLGHTMQIRIAPQYQSLRIRELELTADFLQKQAEQKEHERIERERLREERKVQQEMERERVRLEKERQHYSNALAAIVAKGDDAAAARLREQLGDIDKAIADVDYRAANIRAGYVYVISNLGSFGERMIKVGLTRRLNPLDRIRELSDASVPFNFDVHAMFFSKDAVGIEAAMHERLADRRVNTVNRRREFFYATAAEAKEHLGGLAGELLEFQDIPEALEYRQCLRSRAQLASDSVAATQSGESGAESHRALAMLCGAGTAPVNGTAGDK